MPAVLERSLPSLAELQEGVRIRRQIAQLERKLNRLFEGSQSSRNAYGFSANEMETIGVRLHGKAKKRIAQGQSKKFAGSIEALL